MGGADNGARVRRGAGQLGRGGLRTAAGGRVLRLRPGGRGGLENAIRRQVELAEQTGELDRAHVLALCREGEALCGPMEDKEGLAFFRQTRQQLEEG